MSNNGISRLVEVWWLVRRASWESSAQKEQIYALYENEYQEACDLMCLSYPEVIPFFQSLWENALNEEEFLVLILMEYPYIRDSYHPDRLVSLTTWVEARVSRMGSRVQNAWKQTIEDPGRLKRWDKKAMKEISRIMPECNEVDARKILWLNGIDPKELNKYWKIE